MVNPFDSLPQAGNDASQSNTDAAMPLVQGINQGAMQSTQQPSSGVAQPSSNPFDTLPDAKSQNQTGDSGWFMAGVDGLNRQFEKMAIGTMQLGSYLVPGTQSFRDKLNQLNQQGTSDGMVVGANQANVDWKNHPWAYGAGAASGTIGSAVAGGNILKGVGMTSGLYAPTSTLAVGESTPLINSAANAITGNSAIGQRTLAGLVGGGAAGAAMLPSDTLGGHLTNAAMGAGLGAVASNALPVLMAGVNGIKNTLSGGANIAQKVLSPDSVALQNTAALAKTQLESAGVDTTNPNAVSNAIDNSVSQYNKLGMSPTPSQALGSPSMLGYELNAAKGSENTAKYAAYNQGNLSQLQSQIGNTIDNMAPQSVKDQYNQLYENLKGNNISPESMNNLMQNPTIMNYLGKINSGADNSADESLVANMPNTDIYKLNKLKQDINQDLNSPNISPTDYNNLYTARNNIVNAINAEHPDIYQAAMQAGQKVAIQNNYNNILDTVAHVKGTNIDTDAGNALNNLTQLNTKLFGNDAKMNQFLDDVKTTGGDVDSAKAIIKVANQMSMTDINKILKNNDPTTLGELLNGGKEGGMLQNFILHATGNDYKNAIMNLVTSGDKWVPLIKQEIINQSSKQAQQEGLIKALGQSFSSLYNNNAGILGASTTNTILNNRLNMQNYGNIMKPQGLGTNIISPDGYSNIMK